MGQTTSNISNFFKGRSILSILIGVNILVYLLVLLTGIGSALFNQSKNLLLENIQLPAELSQILYKPWTLISYMFTHASFWHILFNLLWLYWFGQMFQAFFGSRALSGLYFLGGLAGAALFVIAYNLFPYFESVLAHSYLIGASASIMAIVFAVAFYQPNYSIGILFIGQIKIIYIAFLLLLINIITLQSTGPDGQIVLNNAGGFFAHLGGFLMGIGYASAYKRGKDLTKGLNTFFDSVANLFKKDHKKKNKKMKVKYKRPKTDMEYNARKNEEQAEIDRILDKIKKGGYDSLTESEKTKLFDAGKK